MNETQKWPDRLWLVRHGESAGNVARAPTLTRGAAWYAAAVPDPAAY